MLKRATHRVSVTQHHKTQRHVQITEGTPVQEGERHFRLRRKTQFGDVAGISSVVTGARSARAVIVSTNENSSPVCTHRF